MMTAGCGPTSPTGLPGLCLVSTVPGSRPLSGPGSAVAGSRKQGQVPEVSQPSLVYGGSFLNPEKGPHSEGLTGRGLLHHLVQSPFTERETDPEKARVSAQSLRDGLQSQDWDPRPM